MIVYPTAQDERYRQEDLPAGCSADAVSLSGGFFKWPKRWTAEQILDIKQGEIRQALRNHFPEPELYAGAKILLDLEGEPNPGSQRGASAKREEDIAYAADLRIIEASRRFPNSCEIYLWCARNAIQHKPNVDDFGDTASLIHMAKRGMLMGAAGIVMGVYATCTSDENPGKFAKVQSAIETALVMGHAIVHAAKLADGVDRKVMVMGAFEAWREDGRVELPAKDVDTMIGWARQAGVEHYGIWSGRPELVSGTLTTSVLRAVPSLGTAGGGSLDLEADVDHRPPVAASNSASNA